MRVALAAVMLLAAWLLWATLGASAAVLPNAPTTLPAAPGPTAAETAHADIGDATAAAEPAVRASAEREPAPVATGGGDAPVRVLHGRVRLPTGEGTLASVRVGKRTLATAADGVFAIEVHEGDGLLAWRREYEPVQIADVMRFTDGEPLDVALRGKACSIDGVLVTVDGAPCKGWKVDLCGGTLDCGNTELPKLSVEDLVASGRSANDRVFLGRVAFDDGADGRVLRDHTVLSENPNECPIGDDGAFRIGGLRRGHVYELRAWNEKTLQTVRSGPIAAPASGYRFVAPTGEWRERVHGRVIDRRGAPLAGVQVRLTMRVHKNGGSESYETGQTVVTAADGAFTFTHVPCIDLLLRFNGSEVVSLYREFPGNEPADDLVVPLVCQGSFRFESATGVPVPTSLRVLDAGGRALRTSRQLGEGRSVSGERLVWPGDDPNEVFEVSDDAAWLVLEVKGGELRRVPLLLARGEVRLVHG
jgi:hypothetical protein